jgi:hypothetical protein
MPYPITGPDVLVAVESGAAAASAWLFQPDLHQRLNLIGFGLCRRCGFLCFRFGVGF